MGDATPETLLEVAEHIKQLLARLEKRLRQSGGGDDNVVVSLR